MFSVVSNLDLPEDIFDVSEEFVLHVTKCIDKVLQYDKVSLVVLFDTGKDVRRFLKGAEFEKMLYDNHNISFLAVTKSRGLVSYLNDLSLDYSNVDSLTFGDFAEATITDKPKAEEVYHGVVDMINYWCNKLFGITGDMSKLSA